MTADDESQRGAQRRAARATPSSSPTTLERRQLPPRSSSIAAAGRYKGIFREDMFDEGQKLPSPYHRTKFESERIVREECAGAVARLPARRSSSATRETGEMDKIDGPYYFFKADPAAARRRCRSGCRWSGSRAATTNIVPVDFVAKAMDHIAHQRRASTARPSTSPTRTRCRAGRGDQHLRQAPRTRRSSRCGSTRRLLDALPKRRAARWLMQLPPVKDVSPTRSSPTSASRDEVARPTSTSPARSTRRDTEQALDGHRASRCPPLRGLRRQALGLLGAQPRPRPVQGPLAVAARSTARSS